MKVRLLSLWESVRTSFWLVPTLWLLGAVVAAMVLVAIDRHWIDQSSLASILWQGEAQGARTLLYTIGGSMVTVTGVVFSITMVALTIASSQLGPRLVRSFTQDPSTQLALGFFLSTFVYCLVVAPQIRTHSADHPEFVPRLAVSASVAYTVLSLFVLVYFIHHVSVAIQVPTVLARVRRELFVALDREFPEPGLAVETRREWDPVTLDRIARESAQNLSSAVLAPVDGYVDAIDADRFYELACEIDTVIEILAPPGRFVVVGDVIARCGSPLEVDESLHERLREGFVFREERRPTQDIEFSLLQIVEIAMRALSPGINDTITALTALDHMGAFYAALIRRVPAPTVRQDDAGVPRVIVPRHDLGSLLDAGLPPIQRCSRSNAWVTLRLVDLLATVARFATSEPQRKSLREHLDRVRAGALDGVPDTHDREEIERRVRQAVEVLAAS